LPFHHPPTTYIHTLSLHDALPILVPNCGADATFRGHSGSIGKCQTEDCRHECPFSADCRDFHPGGADLTLRPLLLFARPRTIDRSEEHTSELQSRENLVCRLLLEK